MMKTDVWLTRILEVVSEIADPDYQERVWRGGDKNEVSSWDEVMNQFFGDYDVDSFLQDENVRRLVADPQFTKLRELRDALHEYGEHTPAFLSASVVLNDPEWKRIRSIASEVLDAFRGSKWRS